MKHILVVILVVFIKSSVPDKNDDATVFNNHLEIYQKLQRQITLMQIIIKGSTKEIAGNFPLHANSSLLRLGETIVNLKKSFNDQVQTILGSIKLSTDVYQIDSCVNDSNYRFEDLTEDSHRHFNNCIKNYLLEVDRVNGVVNDLLASLVKEYHDLDNVFQFCQQVSETSQYLHQCLYNQFYVDHTIGINRLKSKSREVIEDFLGAFVSGGDHLDSCMNELVPKTHEKLFQLVDVFKICLQVTNY